MKKKNIKIFPVILILLVISFTGTLKAQSVRWAETNDEYARKIGENLYEPVPAGIVSYKFENDKFWMLWNGEPDESGKPKGYLSRKGDRVYYYGRNDEMLGYYVPKTNRYYIVSVLEDGTIGKEDEFALLYEGDLFMGFGQVKYKVDKSFSPEILGCFLFLN